MNLMITGKCNYNCLHCFNAADNAPIMSEWSYEEALDLLDQAEACGVNAITITGGEPMLHRRFMDIVKAIYDRGMFVEELNTNGCFIDQQVLGNLTKCLFYENGWYQKCVEKMGDWRNIDSISHLRERSLSESFPR